MSKAIELRELSFAYGSRTVLEEVNLDVAGGEFIGLVGPNGGGKSTLLKLMLGLLEPRSGSARIFGRRPRQARGVMGDTPDARDYSLDGRGSCISRTLHIRRCRRLCKSASRG